MVFTAHNVNAGKRDENDSWLNRMSLNVQYRLSDHIFVHTDGMKSEMAFEFRIPDSKISVIPFGINNTVPNTLLAHSQAKRQLGISKAIKSCSFLATLLPTRGSNTLVAAFDELLKEDRNYRLLIVGKPERSGRPTGTKFDAVLKPAASPTV